MLLHLAEHASSSLSLSISIQHISKQNYLRFINLIDKVVAFGFHLIPHVFTFLVCHLASLNNSINLLFDFSIGLFKQVGLSTQHIQEVVETVVLLLCLDEGGDCLLDRADTSGFFDLVKSILHRTHIPHVLVHQAFLALVCSNDLG